MSQYLTRDELMHMMLKRPKDAARFATDIRAFRARVAREDINEFMEFVFKDDKKLTPLVQAPVHVKFHRLAAQHPRLIIWSHIEAGKCLAPNTRVLMYDGSTKRADAVVAGDQLMGPDSAPRIVLSTCAGRDEMFRIVPTGNRAPFVCNSVHVLTLINTVTGAVIDIGLDEYLRQSAWWKSQYKLFSPVLVNFPARRAPAVDPYFLGVWFGDGTKALKGVAVSKPDAEIYQLCADMARAWGLRVRTTLGAGDCPTYHIVGAVPGASNALLDAMRAEGCGRARLPRSCRLGSVDVRRAFLAGFLDTDGHLDKPGYYEVVQKRWGYANDLCFIARSLGFRAYMRRKTVNGETYWRVSLSGDATKLPMRIQRKVSPPKHEDARDPRRTGFSVEPLGRGKYAGFTLSGDGRFLLSDFTITHNTTQLSIGRTLFRLGKNHNRRIAIASSAQAGAVKILSAISQLIATPGPLHEVFPDLRPGPLWTSRAITVRRTSNAKDPSVQVTSVGTGAITGSRIDDFIFDDILTYENTRTAANREHTRSWYGSSAISGRLTEDGTSLFVGNAYHPDDMMHELAANRAVWHSERFPVLDQYGTITSPLWSPERVAAKRLECTPDEFARQMLCQARDDNSGRFRREWIDQCLRRGEGKQLAYALGGLPAGYRAYTGVDLGVRKKAGSDLTVLFTIVVHPNEDREIVCVESGRWAANEIVDRIIDTHRRFNSIVIVENNAAQQYIVDFTRKLSAVPVQAFHTGKNKYHPEFGIEGLATEVSNGKWIIPSEGGRAHPEIEAWVSDLLFYDPTTHAGDRLMASWFAREGARVTIKPRGRRGVIDTVSR